MRKKIIVIISLFFIFCCKTDKENSKRENLYVCFSETLNKLKINVDIKIKSNGIFELSLKKPYDIYIPYHERFLTEYLINNCVDKSIKFNVFLDKEKKLNINTFEYSKKEILEIKNKYNGIKNYNKVIEYILKNFKKDEDYLMIDSFFKFTVDHIIKSSSFKNNYNRNNGELFYLVLNKFLLEKNNKEAKIIFLGTYNLLIKELENFEIYPKEKTYEIKKAITHLKQIWIIPSTNNDDIEKMRKKYFE